MVLASKPVASVIRLAARPVGAHKLDALRREDSQNGSDNRGLADPRPAGHDQHLGRERHPTPRSPRRKAPARPGFPSMSLVKLRPDGMSIGVGIPTRIAIDS